MNDLIKIFKALSDKNRIRILKMLEPRKLCVCEITDALDLAPSTVSKHLSILRDAGFILDEKDGKWVNYYLNPDNSSDYTKQLMALFENWLNEDSQVVRDIERVRTADRNILCNIIIPETVAQTLV